MGSALGAKQRADFRQVYRVLPAKNMIVLILYATKSPLVLGFAAFLLRGADGGGPILAPASGSTRHCLCLYFDDELAHVRSVKELVDRARRVLKPLDDIHAIA